VTGLHRGRARAVFALAMGVGAFVGVVALQIATAPRSEAVGPDEYGWWTEANPDDVTGLLPAPTPAAPDVPSGGMLVEGPGSSPSDVAALAFTTDSESTSTANLVLPVASGTVIAPGSQLVACPLAVPDFSPEQGGPMSDAPKWDCSHSTPGRYDATHAAWSFAVGGFAHNGRLSIALLPTGTTDRVVFAKPDANALEAPATPTVTTTTAAPLSTGSPGTISTANSLPPTAPAFQRVRTSVASSSTTVAPSPQIASAPTASTPPRPALSGPAVEAGSQLIPVPVGSTGLDSRAALGAAVVFLISIALWRKTLAGYRPARADIQQLSSEL
jgi:hypothetical protein